MELEARLGITADKDASQNTGSCVPARPAQDTTKGLWDNKPFFRGWPNVELPPKAVFDEIIDVCYHASMLTEEGRPTVFRIVFLDSQSPVSPRDDDELPPVTRYLLQGARTVHSGGASAVGPGG